MLENKDIIQEQQKSSYFKLEDIKVMKLNDELMICPYDAMWYFEAPDAKILPQMAESADIKKYLPGLELSTEEECKKTLQGFMMAPEQGIGFTHVIRYQNFPIGMIIVNSPKYNEKVLNLRIWTCDFFITSMFARQGIMTMCLNKVMRQLMGMQVNFLYAVVEPSNRPCIGLLHKCAFTEIDNSHFHNKNHGEADPLVYRINL